MDATKTNPEDYALRFSFRHLLGTCLWIIAFSLPAAPYTGSGPGTSTIGTGGDYASLSDACQAINAAPLTGGDWTFLILNDLVEASNSYIAQTSPTSNTITLRPAPGTNPTVEFAAYDGSFYAHLTIGAYEISDPPIRELHYVPTHFITIDGSNTPGGTSRDLTFKNWSGDRARTLVGVLGNCSYITIINCNLESNGTKNLTSFGVGASGVAIQFTPAPIVPSDPPQLVPHRCTVENCNIVGKHLTPSAAITVNNRSLSSAPGYSKDITIANCVTADTTLGVLASCVENFAVTSNTFSIKGSMADNFPIGGVYLWTQYRGTVHITKNKVNVTDGEQALRIYGIGLHQRTDQTTPTGATLVDNNMIVIPGYSSNLAARLGIRSLIGTLHARHNSIEMQESSVQNSSTAGIYLGHTSGESTQAFDSGELFAYNNIVRTGMQGGAAVGTIITTGTLHLNNNNYYVSNLAQIGRIHHSSRTIPPIYTLSEWQRWSHQDADSISHDPYVPVEAGDGVWAGPEDDPMADLHFTASPGALYRAPKIPGVDDDIDSEPRSGADVTIGADEIESATGVEDWAIY